MKTLTVWTKRGYEQQFNKLVAPRLITTILCLRQKMPDDIIDNVLDRVYPQHKCLHFYKYVLLDRPKCVSVKDLKQMWVSYGKMKNEELLDLVGMSDNRTLMKTSSNTLCKDDMLKIIDYTDDLVLTLDIIDYYNLSPYDHMKILINGI